MPLDIRFLEKRFSNLGPDFFFEAKETLAPEFSIKKDDKLGVLVEIYKAELDSRSRSSKLKKIEKLLKTAETQVLAMASLHHGKHSTRGNDQHAKILTSPAFARRGVDTMLDDLKAQQLKSIAARVADKIVSDYDPKGKNRLLSDNKHQIVSFVEQFLKYLVHSEPRGIFPQIVQTANKTFRVRETAKNPKTKDERRGWSVYGLQDGNRRIDIVINPSIARIGILFAGEHVKHSDTIFNMTHQNALKSSATISSELAQLREMGRSAEL